MSVTNVQYDFSLSYSSFKLKVMQLFCTHHFMMPNEFAKQKGL